jgi:hypothetical protein
METCAQCEKLILGCPTKSQSVAQSSLSASSIKSEPGFVIFAKFYYISRCQNIQKALQFPKTPCPPFLAHSASAVATN